MSQDIPESDLQRLLRIVAYREAGLWLDDIHTALEARGDTVRQVLARRIEQIGQEIAGLRAQPRLLVPLLGEGSAELTRLPLLDKNG